MPCQNRCCPPHNFVATTDPTVDDCDESIVPGFETEGGYCTGSYWYNTITGGMWIGADDMACGTATWIQTNSPQTILSHVALQLGSAQVIPTATWTKLNYATELNDTDGSYDPVGFLFTAPRDAAYLVNAHVQITTSTGWAIGDVVTMRGIVNNVTQVVMPGATLVFQHSTGTGQVFNYLAIQGQRTYHLSAGDTVYFELFHENAGSITLNSTGSIASFDEWAMQGVV